MRTCRGLTGSFARRRLHASAAAPGGEQVTVASAAPSIADAPAAVLALPRVVMAPRDGAAVAEAQRALIAEQLPSRAYFMAANARHEAGAAAAAAGSRSWERQMARTLLLLRAPEPVDLANPARWSRITYADIATALEGASHSGGSEQTDSAARGATSSGTSRPADVSTDDGFARVAREADAVDDSAARDSARLLDQIVGVLNAAGTPQPQEGTAPSSSTAASSSSGDAPPTATSQSSSAAAVAAKSAGRAPNGVDASPPVTGALPATSPIALMWLQAAEAHIAQVAARLRRYATAASGVPLATASSAAFSPSDVAVANRLLAAFSSVPLQPASEADAAWLRSLAPPSLRAFMSLLLLHRRGLAVPVPTTSGGGGAVLPHMDLLHARLARVDAVAVALRRIREAATATATSNAGANPSPPPTLRSLHGALADAVGDGVPVFTVLRSAAAAAAARFNARLAAEQRRLDDAVAQARRVREGFLGADRKGEAEAASAAVGFDIVGSTPSSSAAVVVSRATGKTVGSLALEDGDGLAARLDQGHLPSALAPLAAILTPAEMAALHTLVAAATPSGIDSLPHPAPGGDVGSRPSNAAVDDVIDDVVTSKSARRLLGVEAAVSDALREALDSLALSGDAGAATSPLPAGFDVAGWRMYITAALEAAAAAGPSAGGERALTSMVRAAAAALPDDLRSIAARAGAGGDPLRSFADRVGISYDDLDAAAADSSIAVAALAADEVDVRAAAGDSISSRDTVPLPLDASAALSSSLVAGVDVIAAGGGGTTPLGGAPRPNQYYPVTQAMVAPDGSVVHVPVVSRLPADFTGTADDGSAPPSPAVADAADAFFDELAAAAGAAAEGDIAGALRAQRAAAARARAERAAEASGGGGGGSASEAEDGDAPAVDDGGAAGPSGRRRALSTTETLRLAQRASAAAERADRADAGENGSSFASGSASFIADIDRPVGAGGVPQPRSMSAGLVVGERDPRRISRYGRIRRIRADTSTLELMRRGAAEGRPVAELEAEATPWTEKVVVAAEGYRAAGSGGAYTLLHERLLEAADAADLEAMFALWFEHCRLTPQEGAPDFLAFEIMMDACASAGRMDLLRGYLWKEVTRLNMVATPAMLFIMIKGASLARDFPLASSLLKLAEREGHAITADHHIAVISAAAAAKRWPDAFAAFNSMRRKGFVPTAEVFEALFTALARDGRVEECHYVWLAISKTKRLRLPASFYTTLITTFAKQGNLDDMQLSRDRMSRRIDGGLKPEPEALLAMLEAYAKGAGGPLAMEVLADLQATPAYAAATPEGAVLRSRADALVAELSAADAKAMGSTRGSREAVIAELRDIRRRRSGGSDEQGDGGAGDVAAEARASSSGRRRRESRSTESKADAATLNDAEKASHGSEFAPFQT